MNVNIFNIAH